MSTAVPYKFNTTASTNLQPLRAGQTCNVKAINAVCTAAYPIFVKIYWTGPNNTPIVVGTSVPSLTFQVNATSGIINSVGEGGVNNQGQGWVAVTKNAADTDTTAVAAGDGIITITVE